MMIDLAQAPPTFTPKWKYKLPSMYKAGDLCSFLIEFFNQSCIENFILNPKYERCISFTLYNRVAAIEQIVE